LEEQHVAKMIREFEELKAANGVLTNSKMHWFETTSYQGEKET